jgi:hypothetical protein
LYVKDLDIFELFDLHEAVLLQDGHKVTKEIVLSKWKSAAASRPQTM